MAVVDRAGGSRSAISPPGAGTIRDTRRPPEEGNWTVNDGEPVRDMALQAWLRTRIGDVRQQAKEAREAAAEMDDPTVAFAARQLADDLEGLAEKWSSRLRDVTGDAEGAPPV